MNTEKGSIMILKGRKYLEVMASTHPELIGLRQPIDMKSPSSWVVKNNKVLLINRMADKAIFGNDFHHYAKEAFLLAPIQSNNRVVGVLSVTEKMGEDKFSQSEQEVFLSIAGQVISALENHRLTESLKKSRSLLNKKNIELKRIEKIRTELFNMLIHDLKGPLSDILANIDILSYTINDNNLDYVKAAQAGCDTLYRMISDLLDIARLEEGNLKLVFEEIEPEDLMNEAISRLHTLAKIREIKFIKKFQPSERKNKMYGDRGLLLRVIQNLLTNAMCFSDQREAVEVGFEFRDSDKIIFFIRDNGPGVPLEFQDAIFNKFVQLSKKKDGRKYSTGLGLTFCKLAVEAHDGNILVESDGIKGSCFKFILPIINREIL
ncbi:MAG: GAF domain-containing protein [Desulfobacterales bacterium]|nr:GAF domain-containing protein [Desulfobacterales bacterium]